MVKRRWLLTATGVLLLIVGIVFLIFNVARRPMLGVGRNVAVMNVNLSGVNLGTIKSGSKDIKYPGNQVQLWDRGEYYEFADVEVKGRGNATWLQPKKPFQLKFARNTELLGLGKNRKWVLLANSLDLTNLRNMASFEVAEMAGMKYAPRGDFVELAVDGEYEGLYVLIRKTEVSKGSVDLKNDLGILVELDNLYGRYETCYYSGEGNCLVISDVVNKGAEMEAMADFMAKFNRLEMAAAEGNYAGLTEVADTESLAQYFLVSEYTADVDAYLTSIYFYSDGARDKIHAGPGWDFDMTFGNSAWRRSFEPTTDVVLRDELEEWDEQYGHITKIYYDLLEIPEFQEEVRRVYQERMEGRGEELARYIAGQARRIRPLMILNSAKWWSGERLLGKWMLSLSDYDSEVEKMVEWTRARGKFMDEKYGNSDITWQSML